MYSYRKTLAIIIMIAALLCLFSCAPARGTDALGILKRPAELTAEGERNGVAFRAQISLGEMREDGTRSAQITYSLPDSFGGLKVKTDSGVWEAVLGEVTVSGKAAEELGAPLAPFLQENSAVDAELIRSEIGEAQTLITARTNVGTFEYLIDSKSGLPISLCEKNGAGETVMEFKITEYKIKNDN